MKDKVLVSKNVFHTQKTSEKENEVNIDYLSKS